MKQNVVLRMIQTLVVLEMVVLAGCVVDKLTEPKVPVNGNQSGDSDSSLAGGGKRPMPEINRLHPDTRTAIAYECYYALRNQWWTVSWVWSAGGQVHRSNWAYLLSDPNAHGKIVGWYGLDASVWRGFPSYFTNMNVYSWTDYNRYGHHTGTYRSHGGQCRGFANLIVFRAGVRDSKFPSYGANPLGYRPYSQIRIGDVIETYAINGHTAIVVGVVEGSVGTSVRKVVVVDSNFIGDEETGMHVLGLSGSGPNNLANYRALNLGY